VPAGADRLRLLVPRRASHWALAIALLLLVVRLVIRSEGGAPRDFPFDSPGPCRVARVLDGRTLVLLDGNVPLRLIGVEPCLIGPGKPEVAALERQAVELLGSHAAGRDVTLQFDRERQDREGRLLAYVFADRVLVNEELIRAGLARLAGDINLDRTMGARLRRAEDEARNAGRGIWSVSTEPKR
jgi:micrococcal nuclease